MLHRLLLSLAMTACTFAGPFASLQGQVPASALSPAPEDATVTFYSPSYNLVAGLGGKGVQTFRGHIFDDHRLLTFIGMATFISFTLPSGIHDFSIDNWMSKSDDHGVHLLLYLSPGEHYFIELRTIVHPSDFVYHYGPLFGIENKKCLEASKEMAGHKPLDAKHLTKIGAPLALQEETFPACPPEGKSAAISSN